jgi:hypothetical protein
LVVLISGFHALKIRARVDPRQYTVRRFRAPYATVEQDVAVTTHPIARPLERLYRDDGARTWRDLVA